MSKQEETMLLQDFYIVKSSGEENGKFITHIEINKDHNIFKGHFPERPVSPGVILMQLFKEDAERRLMTPLQLKTANNIKFMAVVDPRHHSDLILEYHLEKNSGGITLKGIARTSDGISLKIKAVYKII